MNDTDNEYAGYTGSSRRGLLGCVLSGASCLVPFQAFGENTDNPSALSHSTEENTSPRLDIQSRPYDPCHVLPEDEYESYLETLPPSTYDEWEAAYRNCASDPRTRAAIEKRLAKITPDEKRRKDQMFRANARAFRNYELAMLGNAIEAKMF